MNRPLDALPAVSTRYVLCTEDRFFPAAFCRRLVDERLGIVPDEIESGHCAALSRPVELSVMLDGYVPDGYASLNGELRERCERTRSDYLIQLVSEVGKARPAVGSPSEP
jgi:hypothetical protein